ncbi:MAG: peptidylprolyl isomerase [Nitrospinota bacterium]
MIRVFKKQVVVSIFFVIVFLCAAPLRAELVDMIAARVNDQIILLSDIRIRLAQTVPQEKLKTLTGDARADLEKRALDQIIEEKMLVHYAASLGISVDENLIEKNIQAIKKNNNMADWQLEEALSREGITMDEYHEVLKEQRLISLVMNQEVTSQVFVDDKEVKSYYDKNSAEFMTDEEIRVRHIFVKSSDETPPEKQERAKSRIDDILKRLRKGEDFTELAKIYSEDTTASSGGDLGFFVRGKMVAAFEDVAFGLNVGDISDVVKTGFGYHIIQCLEKKAKSPLPFEDAKVVVKNKLFGVKANEKKIKLIEKLKKDIIVEKKL